MKFSSPPPPPDGNILRLKSLSNLFFSLLSFSFFRSNSFPIGEAKKRKKKKNRWAKRGGREATVNRYPSPLAECFRVARGEACSCILTTWVTTAIVIAYRGVRNFASSAFIRRPSRSSLVKQRYVDRGKPKTLFLLFPLLLVLNKYSRMYIYIYICMLLETWKKSFLRWALFSERNLIVRGGANLRSNIYKLLFVFSRRG